MQTVTEFMNDFFVDRNAEEERYLKGRESFRQKYYANGCQWDSRAGTLEMNQSEVIITIEEAKCEARVITAFRIPISGNFQIQQVRYNLKRVNGNWLIWRVDIGCTVCGERGDTSCIICNGKHWFDGLPLGDGP